VRTHRVFDLLAPWSTGTPVSDPGRLAAVRIEPVLRQRRATLYLDCYLIGEDGDTVVPSVLVEPALVVERDRDALLFPTGMRGGDAFAAALQERILPHLDLLVRSGEPICEHVLRFAPTPRFDAARALGAFGAAPLRDALVRLAPYWWARRYARGRTVRIDAPDAVGGWALLRDVALVGVAAERRAPDVLAWYGQAPVAEDGGAVVAIIGAQTDAPSSAETVVRLDVRADDAVGIVDPLPIDIGIVFDPLDGPPRRWFAVERVAAPMRRGPTPPWRSTPQGGSAGRIAIVLGRADAAVHSDADTDEAAALALGLAGEGFEVVDAHDPADLAGVDLVHVFGTGEGKRVRAIVDAARRARIPSAVHAYEEDAAAGGWWGATVARLCFEYGADEASVERYLALLARRAVTVENATAEGRYAPPEAGVEDAAAALRDASIVFTTSDHESQAVLRRSGRRSIVAVVPPLVGSAQPAEVGVLVGPDPYALVHAPIGPAANQLLVARAAVEARVPLVLAGPVVDASYLERVREFGGRDLVVVPEPSAARAAGLRAAAAVVVDAAWLGAGAARLAAAVVAGTHLVIAERRPFSLPDVTPYRVDPADVGALTRALGEAWDQARRQPPAQPREAVGVLAPDLVLRSIVRGYAEAAKSLA
jgi:hypothetical protein